jgi:hypothetical protein
MKKILWFFGLCFVSSLIFVGIVLAQLPKEGTSAGTASFSGAFKALPMGQERVQMTYEVFGVNLLDGGEGLLHNTSFRCLGALHAIKGVYEDDSGFCVYTRPDGDQAFQTYKATGRLGVGGKGTGVLVGGTGKLTGIQGTSEFTRNSSLKSSAEGTFQGFNRHKGSFKLP